MSSLKPIGNIVVICCAFFIIFGILGVQVCRALSAKKPEECPCLGPRIPGFKLLPPSFQKGISRNPSLQAPGLRPFGLLGILQQTENPEEVPKGGPASERLPGPGGCRLLSLAPGAPQLADAAGPSAPGSPPFLPRSSRAGGMPGLGIQGPDSWARLAACWQAGGCRPQTRQEVGLLGRPGFWPREKLGFRGERARAACRIIQPLGIREPLRPVFVFQCSPSSCRVDSWLLGQHGSSWVASTPPPLLSLASQDVYCALGRGCSLVS